MTERALQEWDGLMHLCFSRKNKTLSAIFKQKNVLELFESNYKTFCSLNNQPLDAAFDPHKAVNTILERTGSAEKRSAKMDIDDFLKCVLCVLCVCVSCFRVRGLFAPSYLLCSLLLTTRVRLLAAFNEAGIHFA